MKLAFVAFRYSPYGGLERDMLAMAQLCQQRGHDVLIVTASWDGPVPEGIRTALVPVQKTLTNPDKDRNIVRAILEYLEREPERIVVGFNKMPGLDFYYAADRCFAAKVHEERGPLYRLLPRTRQKLAFEEAIFSSANHTHCLMIAEGEIARYQNYHATPDERIHLLPPGIRRDRVMPPDYDQRRNQLRQGFGLESQQRLILLVGSNYKLKGVDIAIRALSELAEPWATRTLLWIAGEDKPDACNRLARQLGLGARVRILGARDDISQLLWSADLLAHPAHSENTGTVLLEAMIAGLPVIASDTCGYATYIQRQQMGQVLPTPVEPSELAKAMAVLLEVPRAHWIEKGRDFAEEDIYSMTERAAEVIERLGKQA